MQIKKLSAAGSIKHRCAPLTSCNIHMARNGGISGNWFPGQNNRGESAMSEVKGFDMGYVGEWNYVTSFDFISCEI